MCAGELAHQTHSVKIQGSEISSLLEKDNGIRHDSTFSKFLVSKCSGWFSVQTLNPPNSSILQKPRYLPFRPFAFSQTGPVMGRGQRHMEGGGGGWRWRRQPPHRHSTPQRSPVPFSQGSRRTVRYAEPVPFSLQCDSVRPPNALWYSSPWF